MSEYADWNTQIIEEFRANKGVVGGPFEGATLLLLTTTGAKSGEPRLSPLAYLTIDDKMIIVGSKAGADTNPAWVHNLRANPVARIQDGADLHDLTVREVDGDEKAQWWARGQAIWPDYDTYQASTDRTIPVFVLEPAG